MFTPVISTILADNETFISPRACGNIRISAHESMERWYESFGKKAEAMKAHKSTVKLIEERQKLE